MRSNIFDRLAFLSLSLVLVLLPLFCLPFTSIPIETSKGLLLVVGLALTILFWSIARFFDGKVIFPKSSLLLAGFGVVIAFLLSALMSQSREVSLFGTMFDIGSFWFIFTGFILMLAASLIFRNPIQAKVVLLGVILSSALVLIFQSLHVFFPNILSLGILSGKTGNILGSWNALGLFAGFSCLMFLLQLEFFPASKNSKIILKLLILLSLLVAVAVNFPTVWILVGISALIIFVYKASISFIHKGGGVSEKHFPAVSFIVVIIALLFFISGQFIGAIVPNYLKISNSEVGPNFKATAYTAKNVLMKDPVFGLGPNRFSEAWAMYKPASVNSTQFWDVAFDSGAGLLPTFWTTTGGLGILAWLAFLALFLFTGVKSVFFTGKKEFNKEMMAFFVLSLYLFIAAFLYATGTAIFLLALAFSGVFVGLSAANEDREATIKFLSDPRKSFFSILGLIVLVILSLAAAFKFIERLTSVSYFGKALAATTVPVAETSISKALALYTNDLYLRTYAQVYLVKLNSIISKGGSLSEKDKADVQAAFNQAVNGARMAVAYNPDNYLNHELLGSVYLTVGSLGVKDAYSQALVSYKTASTLNPLNPGLRLSMANASFLDGKVSEAKNFAKAALDLKPDYVDALITLSQIAKKEGNMAEARSYAESALAINPANKDVVNYLKSLNSGL
jgi:tetratricopeptide (TPR) repeat protein